MVADCGYPFGHAEAAPAGPLAFVHYLRGLYWVEYLQAAYFDQAGYLIRVAWSALTGVGC